MQKTDKLEDVSWVAGGTRLIKLDNLRPGKRVRAIELFFDLSGTKTSTDTLDGQLFAQSVASIKIGDYVQSIPGWELQQLLHDLDGKVTQDPTDIPGTGTTFDMEFSLRIPFRNPKQPASDDGSMPTDMLRGKSIELTFASATVWGVGTLAVTAGSVRTEAEIVDEVDVPQIHQIGYADPGALTVPIEGGWIYESLFICDGTTPGSITRAEVSQATMTFDGEQIHSAVLHEQLVSHYNRDAVRDAAAELTQNAATRLPLVWQDWTGKANLTKQPAVEKSGKLQLTGTITSPRVVYMRTLIKDENTVQQAVKKSGGDVSNVHNYEPATATKTVPRAVKHSINQGRWSKKARLVYGGLRGKLRSA